MKFPTAFTIILLLAAIVALLTRILPAGNFQKLSYDADRNVFTIAESVLPASQKTLDSLGVKIALSKFTNGDIWKPIALPGTFKETAAQPQGLVALFQAPLKGIVESIDIILFVLILGGTIGIVHYSGAFNAGIATLSTLFRGKEYWMIFIVLFLIALGGTTFGLAEETIAFYPILVPMFLAAGYDAMVAIACVYIGSSLGTMFSTTNPFSAIIGSNAAGINWTEGLLSRIVFLVIGLGICYWYILRYAQKVKKDPSKSLIANQKAELESKYQSNEETKALNSSQKISLLIFSACFVLMIYGVSKLEWWFLEMTTVFFIGSILIGIVSRIKEKDFVDQFVNGAAELLSVALIIGIARGVTILMDEGQISDTLLYYCSNLINGMPKMLFINILYVLYMGLSLFVPSSSGMAVLTMPIFAPLADVIEIGRHEIVNAYQYGQGLIAFINPSGLILATLTMVNVGFNKWLKFVMPLVGILFILGMIALSIGVSL